MSLLICAAAVAMAFAMPAVASASNWTKNGVAISGLQWSKGGTPLGAEGGSIAISGGLKLTGSIGTLDCQASGSASLSGNSGSGQLTELTISPASCTLGGLLKPCTETKSITANSLPWSINAAGTAAAPTIAINGVSITYTLFCGGETLPLKFTGKLTATPNKATAISSLSLSGTLSSASGNVSASGTQAVSPAGTYGIINQQEAVAVKGSLGWTGSLGSTNCQVTGSMILEAGSEGKVTSLAASECHSTGLITSSCGSGGSMTPSTPWTLVDNGTSIAIKNVSIASCGFTNPFLGELTATPDKTSAISSTSLTGTLNSGGINVAWSGTLNWTPAGVFGL